jgi:uncharacterized protein YndB with AHSA1/START domain
MVKIVASVLIDRPAEAAWKLITDLSKLTKWDTSVSEAKWTSAGPIGVGATCDLTVQVMGKMTVSQRVIEYEPNRKFSLEFTSGPAKGSIVTFSMETIEGKTRFTSSNDLKYNGFYKLLAPFVTRTLNKSVVDTVYNVKRILESEAQS